ncbi:MAG: 5-methyltetrahydropteroyltriglutamate--homocysteine S-methyltransferase, partial [Proteobacteria bacterium]
MTIAHNLGFPRIGKGRELKWALESYWRGESGEDALLDAARTLKQRHWRLQANAGLDQLPVGDFSLYDHVLDHSVMLGAVPARFGDFGGEIDLDTRFRMARGRAPRGKDADACEMTKWFDTNYHYIVPELVRNQQFRLSSHELFDDVELARQIHASPRPVLLGPLTWLWLGKVKGQAFDRLDLVDELLPVYADILERLDRQGVEWVQIDEPILVTDLPVSWRYAFETVYRHLAGRGPKVLLAT